MVVAWVGIFSLAGCGGSTGSPLDRFTAGEQARTDSYCGRCWMAGGWMGEEECRGNVVGHGSQAFYGDLSPSELACIDARYVPSGELDAALVCLADAMAAFVACNATCVNSPTDTVADACYDAFVLREDACVASSAVAAQIETLRDCAAPL